MTKILAFVIIALMAIQIIRPIGLPGLRKRADFWKIGLAAIAAIALTIAIRPGG